MSDSNPYRQLGVAEGATDDAITTRYRALARELHPDATGGDPAKAERFKLVAAAYGQLRTPEGRRGVDERILDRRLREAVEQAIRVTPTQAPVRPRHSRRPTGIVIARPRRRRATSGRKPSATFAGLAEQLTRGRATDERLGWVTVGFLADLSIMGWRAAR